MGCAACLNTAANPQSIQQHKAKKLCSSLRPHTLVPQHERALVIKMIFAGDHLKLPGPDPAMPMFPLPQQRLSYWKVMLLCKNVDFTKEPLDASINKKHKCVEQIGLDIKRTFIGKFQEKELGVLSRVLIKLASFIPQVGYTQGMNYVAGFFILLGFEEQEVFWLMVHLFLGREYLMVGMFEDDFPMTRIYIELFNKKLEQLSPELYQHLQKSNVPNEAWLFQWVLTWYLYNISPQQCVCLWQHIIRRGGLSVPSIAISILLTIKDDLLANQPNYSIYNKLKSENLLPMIDLNKILIEAEKIDVYPDLIQPKELGEKAQKYLEIMQSSKQQPYKDFLDSIKKQRIQYFAAS